MSYCVQPTKEISDKQSHKQSNVTVINNQILLSHFLQPTKENSHKQSKVTESLSTTRKRN